jgi:hypothetical protein
MVTYRLILEAEDESNPKSIIRITKILMRIDFEEISKRDFGLDGEMALIALMMDDPPNPKGYPPK